MAANTRITPTATGAVVHSGVSGAPDVVAVALTDGAGNVIKATDNGDGTATLASSATIGAGSTVKILDSGGTNVAAVSAAGAVKVDGSAATQPVSAATLPLPTGAASAAKQPALGTAGAASVDVLSVQGIASMTALKTDSSATTQPVSAASLPLPTGASTAAKQPALGTAGSASADVITVQGAASMTALTVDTELPAAAALSDTLANPTTPMVGAANMYWDGAQWVRWQRKVQDITVAAATLANVAGSASSVTLFASNANARGRTVYNDSTATLYLKYGATASTTSFTVALPPAAFFEFPGPVYTGIVDGIWSAAAGFCRATEV